MNKNRFRNSRGFTLIELLIVISIILILIGMAAGNYRKTVIRANETVLKQDLVEMRKAIDNYTLDKQAAPQALSDLVPDYLRAIPKDPITQDTNWNPDIQPVVLDPNQASTGIVDVHSASDKVSPFDGTAYNSW